MRASGGVICVYASEVAALAGMHPYRAREHVVSAILKRRGVDAVDSAQGLSEKSAATAADMRRDASELQEAASADEATLQERESRAAALAREAVGREAAVREAAEREAMAREADRARAQRDLDASSPTTLCTLQRAMQDARDHADAARREVGVALAQVKTARSASTGSRAAAAAAAKRAVVAAADAAAAKRVATEARRHDVLQAQVARVLRTPAVAQSLQTAVASSSTTRDALARFRRTEPTRAPAVARELQSAVACRMGQKMEAAALGKYATTSVPPTVHLDVKQKGYTHGGLTTPRGVPFKLFGRLDGLRDDGAVVETKNRRNRIFGYVPTYERIQLHTYMVLTSTKHAVLVENFEEHQQTHDVLFDESFWQDTVLPALKDGVDEVDQRCVLGFP